MTNLSKVLIIIVLVLVIIALCTGLYMLFRVYTAKTVDGSMQSVTVTFPSDVAEIRTDLAISDVTLSPTDGDEITVTYYDIKKGYYDFSVQDNVLVLERNGNISIIDVGIVSIEHSFSVNIGVPKSFDGSLNIATSTGFISANDISTSQWMNFASTTGEVKVTDLTSGGAFNISARTGSLSVDGVKTSALSATTTTGSISIENTDGIENLDVTASTGRVSIENAAADATVIKTSTGSIRIKGFTVGKSIDLSASTGSIACELTNKDSEFTITSHSSTGSNNLPESFGGGEKTIRANTSTGSIKFTFAE